MEVVFKKGKKERKGKEWKTSFSFLKQKVENLRITLINLYGEKETIENACTNFINKVVKTSIQKRSKKIFPQDRQEFNNLNQIEIEEIIENMIFTDFFRNKFQFEKKFWKKENSDKIWIPNKEEKSSIGPLEKEDEITDFVTVSRKIRIYPSFQQKEIFKEWMSTSRFVYNRCLNAIENGEKINFQDLRNKYVTKKSRDGTVNSIINDWECFTPKEVRAGTIKHLETNFKSAFTNLKRCNIERFKMGYKRKRINSYCTLKIPKSAIKVVNNKFQIYPRFKNKEDLKLGSIKKCKEQITEIISDSLLFRERNGDWYISTCIKKPIRKTKNQNRICALDPGIRKFQTLYGEKETKKFTINHELIKKIKNRISLLQELRTKGRPYNKNYILKRSVYIKKINKCWKRINNQIDELHYKTINYLTTHYNQVYLPIFESQEMVKTLKNPDTKFNLLNLKHYLFQTRLIDKSRETDTKVSICTEEYTSRTCTGCGIINEKLGSSEIFKCDSCNLEIDRDINGARNIFLKNHY